MPNAAHKIINPAQRWGVAIYSEYLYSRQTVRPGPQGDSLFAKHRTFAETKRALYFSECVILESGCR